MVNVVQKPRSRTPRRNLDHSGGVTEMVGWIQRASLADQLDILTSLRESLGPGSRMPSHDRQAIGDHVREIRSSGVLEDDAAAIADAILERLNR